jgi:hypothetical protein
MKWRRSVDIGRLDDEATVDDIVCGIRAILVDVT